MPQQTEKQQQTPSMGLAYEIPDFIKSVLGVLFGLLIIMALALRYAVVDGSSMERTFFNGDRTIVSDFLYTPKRGDVVAVFEAKTSDKALIKRVIGLEGDVISVSGGVVYVNGIPLDEPYLFETMIDTRGDLAYPHVVSDGCVFVMGDNRNDSQDSRYSAVGDVPREAVIGKVMLRFFPLDAIEIFD